MLTMRWSWNSFGAGLLGGALLATLLWMVTSEPGAGSQDEAATSSESPRAPIGSGTDTRDAPEAAPSRPGASSDLDRKVVAELPSAVRDAPRGRPRVTIPTTGGAGAANAEGDAAHETAPVSVSTWNFSNDAKGRFRISFGKGDSSGRTLQIFAGSLLGFSTDPAPALLAWSKRRANEELADGHDVAYETAAELLREDSYAARAAGLGIALRTEPPALDLLLAAARDTAYPDLRGAALLAAAEADIEHDAVRALILDAALDGDAFVRRAATDLLPRLGDEGGRRAAEVLLNGDYTVAVLGPLASAVAGSSAAGPFLGASPPADAALQVVSRLAARLAMPQNERDERLAATLPELIRPLLQAPSADTHAAQIFPQLAALGHGAFLRGVAAAPMYRQSVRAAAANAALGNEKTRSEGISAVVAILSDPGAEVALVRSVLAEIDTELLEDPTLRSSLEAAARSHPSAWVRNDAQARLSAHAPGHGGTLIIHDAEYGVGDGWVDVTAQVRAAIAAGGLTIQAGNQIAGDPNVGHLKTLRVEYSLGGVRHLKRTPEGQQLRIP